MPHWIGCLALGIALFGWSGEGGVSPIDPDFIAGAERLEVRENSFKRAFYFAGAGGDVVCRYSIGWRTTKSSNWFSGDGRQTKTSKRTIVNGFNQRTYRVRSVSEEKEPTDALGLSGGADYSVSVVDADSDAQVGWFRFDGESLEGRLHERAFLLRERNKGPDGRFLPLKRFAGPMLTSGYFCIEGDGEVLAEIELQTERRGKHYLLYLKGNLEEGARADVITLFLMLPSVRAMKADLSQ